MTSPDPDILKLKSLFSIRLVEYVWKSLFNLRKNSLNFS